MVGVFDRSHYEDVLIHRVHRWASPEELERRYRAINEFEARQTGAGTKIVKVMLHISRDEQKERLLARLDDPAKLWKYSGNDLKERAFWEDYMDAYQKAFDKTSTEHAPWHVVPANKKWYARIAVQQLLLEALESLKLAVAGSGPRRRHGTRTGAAVLNRLALKGGFLALCPPPGPGPRRAACGRLPATVRSAWPAPRRAPTARAIPPGWRRRPPACRPRRPAARGRPRS